MKNLAFLFLFLITSLSLIAQEQTDCSHSDGTYLYFVVLNSREFAPNDIDKSMFINLIVDNDNISDDEVIYLEQNLLDVYKPFVNSNSELLQRVIVVHTIIALENNFDSYTNSIEFYECIYEALPLSLRELDDVQNIKIYPNPAKHSIHIATQLSYNQIQIFNSEGKLVMNRPNPYNQINISQLPIGTYVIRILIDNKVLHNQRFIKQ